MSNYTKIVDFAAKDSLLTGNPAKLITGTAHDNEYNAIATAVATKVDSGGALGTPTSGTLTSCTGLPISTGVNGLGTGVATALAVNVGSAGAAIVNGGALGTPSSGTLTGCTGLPQAGTVGLTTSDSPQFAGVNVGHASDTTLTRASAGVLAVEGVNVLTMATGAALAGSSSQVFLVGTATAAAHALRAGQYGSQINGWTYSNNATDPTNDLDIAAGSGLDSTRAYFIVGAAMTKQSDVAFAEGTGTGMLDTGAAGNSDYYIWAIARSDTGAVDYLSSLSSTAPTMPANYDYKRLIGWFKRVGGTIVAFHTYELGGGELQFVWNAPTIDINLANTLTTSRRTDAIKVPLNFSVLATIGIRITDAAGAFSAMVCDPNLTDAAPVDISNISITAIAAGSLEVVQHEVRTSSTGTIAARSNVATVDSYTVSTRSFKWARRV